MIVNTIPMHTLKKDIRRAEITVITQGLDSRLPNVYDGRQHWPVVTVVYNGETLVENTDYTVSYTNQINAGSYPCTITGIGDFRESTIVQWTITRASVQGGSFSASPESISRSERTDVVIYASIPSTYDENFTIVVFDEYGLAYARKRYQSGRLPTLTLENAYADRPAARLYVYATSQNYVMTAQLLEFEVVT